MIQMVYFVHDNSNEEGAFCVVPSCACNQPHTFPPHPHATSDGVSCLRVHTSDKANLLLLKYYTHDDSQILLLAVVVVAKL